MRHALALLLLVACSASPALSPRDCTPGATVACACPGTSGVQTCGAEGTLGACVCADAGAPREDASPQPQDASPVADAGADGATAAIDAPPAPDAPTCDADTRIDPANCGACGRACYFAGATARCVLGGCFFGACRDGFADCDFRQGNGCEVETRLNNANCGACGRACPSGQLCSNGVCGDRCSDGLLQCGGTCHDLRSDRLHCGACGRSCGGERCVDWNCVPAPAMDAGVVAVDAPASGDAPDVVDVRRDTAPPCEPRNLCGSVCVVDYQTDPQNCGACFISCPATATGSVPTCRGGRCTIGCREGLVTCGTDRCVNPLAPTFDCADCGFSCPDGQRCNYDGRRGTCVPR